MGYPYEGPFVALVPSDTLSRRLSDKTVKMTQGVGFGDEGIYSYFNL